MPLRQSHNYVAGFGAGVGTDDAVVFHEVDEPRGSPVADSQRALKQRNRPAAFANDDLDGLLVNLYSILKRFSRYNFDMTRIGDAHVDEFVHKVLFAGANGIRHGSDFFVG